MYTLNYISYSAKYDLIGQKADFMYISILRDAELAFPASKYSRLHFRFPLANYIWHLI